MSGHDVQLLLTALGGVVILVALIVSRIRLHPLLALMGVSILVGVVSGMDLEKIATAVEKGAGGTLGDVGIVVALGVMLGKILADSAQRRSSRTRFCGVPRIGCCPGQWLAPRSSSVFRCFLKLAS